MAIIKEFYKTRDDGVNLYRTYSDLSLKIQKVGTNMIYNEAVDVESVSYTYIETDTPCNEEENIMREEIDINVIE